jgi:hypothetical protein
MNVARLVRAPLCALALSLLLLSTGCLEVEDQWVINPDGSGKVTRRAVFASIGKTPQEWLAKAADDSNIEGIEVWGALEATQREDGQIELVATGYFQDVAKVKLPPGGLRPRWTPAKDGSAVLDLLVKPDKKPKLAAPLGKPEPKDPTLGESGWKVFRSSLEIIRDVKLRTHVRVGGKASPSPGLRAREKGFEVRVDCARVLKALDELLQDPKFVSQPISALDFDHPEFCAKVLGTRGPLRLQVTQATQPLFDYRTEVAAAKAALPALRKAAGLPATKTPPVPAPKAKGGKPQVPAVGLKRAHLGSVLSLLQPGAKQILDGSPLPKVYPQLRVQVLIELTRPVTSIKSARLTKATDRGGANLRLPRGDQKDSLEEVAPDGVQCDLDSDDDKKHVLKFGASLALPKGFKGFSELAGEVSVVISAGKKEVDLGLPNLNQGSVGKKLGALVKEVRKDSGMWYELLLKGVEPSQVAGVHLMSKGKKFEIDYFQAMGDEDDEGKPFTDLTLSIDSKLPKTYTVVVVLHAGRKTVVVPFKLTKLDALGRPRKAK